MTIRTPRRRISPRTKQRYRAIRDFLRKALGTSSQPDIKTNSSIAVSVSDLKNKIIRIEEQLHKVSKHCRDLSCLEHNFIKKSLNQSHRDESINIPQESSRDLNEIETKVIYKSSNRQCVQSDESNTVNIQSQDDKNNMTSNNQNHGQNFCDFKEYFKDFDFNVNKDHNFINKNKKIQPKYKTAASIYSTSSLHSLIEDKNTPYSRGNSSGLRKEKRYLRKEFNEPIFLKHQRNKEKIEKDPKLQDITYEGQLRPRKSKRKHLSLDQDFIADIIKKQYKPVKLFGRRDSDFSQFSAPVCHDQEFKIRDGIDEDCELCSCCFEEHRHKRRYIRNSDLSDIKSICDARLYGSKKYRRHKYNKGCIDDYNNSTYYDVVPVKEKSSPMSRRKFAENNMTAYRHCREVPPSPRSNRPRLNLEAQHHTEYVENSDYAKYHRKNSPSRQRRKETRKVYETDISSECFQPKKPKENIISSKIKQPLLIQEDVGTMSGLQYPNFINEQNNLSTNDTTMNTQITDSLADKTDKTLSEIKDILQSFLQEIKRESTHGGQSEVSSKIDDKHLNENQDSNKINTMIPNSGHSFSNYGVGQCGIPPFVPAFTNPCCYPIMPMYPMNCLQNGYVIPTPSYTHNVCSKNSRTGCNEKDCCNSKNKTEGINNNSETQDLIKEIYKFVSQNPKVPRPNIEHCNDSSVNSKYSNLDKKILTSRSVGGSTKATHHDANEGTPNLKCQSKSCEAIGCRNDSESFNTTNASYSDTILEKLSLEATQSSTGSNASRDIPTRKNKRSKLKKVLKSLKIFKKKYKRDVIEEESESESTVEVEIKPKSPYRQQITNYTMHGQEYFQTPPILQPDCCSQHRHGTLFGYDFDPRSRYLQSLNNVQNHLGHQYANHPLYTRTQHPAQPCLNYEPHLHNVPPQVPLCLKEIEVKSIGTQSVRKMSILQKLTAKSQTPQQPAEQPILRSLVKEKSTFWKTLQEKAKQNNPDPMDFSLKTQKQLAQGDMKMRNAMLKKLFYKRNPFSPRNLIIKTILGKDKSSFGDPPKMYRPRMFL